jgi:hypothetical protein
MIDQELLANSLMPVSCIATDECIDTVREMNVDQPPNEETLVAARELYWLHRHVPVSEIAQMLGVKSTRVASLVRPGPILECSICGKPGRARNRGDLTAGVSHCDGCIADQKSQAAADWERIKDGVLAKREMYRELAKDDQRKAEEEIRFVTGLVRRLKPVLTAKEYQAIVAMYEVYFGGATEDLNASR